jgi:hypothetical protein
VYGYNYIELNQSIERALLLGIWLEIIFPWHHKIHGQQESLGFLNNYYVDVYF